MKSFKSAFLLIAVLVGIASAFAFKTETKTLAFDYGILTSDATFWYVEEETNDESQGIHYECDAVTGTPTCTITTSSAADGLGRVPKARLASGDAIVTAIEDFRSTDPQ